MLPPGWRLRIIPPLLALFCWLLAAAGAQAADLPTEVEKWIGKQVADILNGQMGLTSDRNLSQWVARMGQEVSAVAPRQDLRYEFSILDVPEENAFALPGGYIFVTLGLLRKAASEAEVAAVLAHEVGHVSERHSMKYAAASLASYFGLRYVNDHTRATWHAVAQAGVYLGVLRLSRRLEAQSDRRAVKFAYEAGYDPEGLVEFFQAIDEGRRSYLDTLFATHPSTEDRIKAAQGSPLLSPDNYEALLQRAHSRRGQFDLAEAMALCERAARLRPEELAPRLELASLAADRGLLLSAASRYDSLGESYPTGKAEAEDLRKQAKEWTLVAPNEEEVGAARTKVQALTEVLSSGKGEMNSLAKKNDDAIEAMASARQVNSLMDSVLLLEPNFWDEKRLALLAQAKATIQSILSSSEGAADLNQNADSLLEQWREFSRQLRAALNSPQSPEAFQLLTSEIQTIAADGGLAARISKDAGEDCSAALHNLKSSLGALTPLMLSLLDAGVQKHDMSLAAALALQALALKAEVQASQADRQISRASQDCSTAFLRLRQWQLELKYAQSCPRARDTLVKMLAYQLGVEESQVADSMSNGLGYGQAAIVLAIGGAKGVPAAEVLEAGESPTWVDVAQKWDMRPDALLVPLDLLWRKARAMSP